MWLKGADVASVLGYINTRNAVANHVDDEDKIKFEEVKGRLKTRLPDEEQPHTIFINKSGLISLVLCSKKTEAKAFKRWITTEVIPAILSTGGYNLQNQAIVETRNLTHNQYMMRDEFDLHIRLVKFIREYYPHLILVPGLGENQTTENLRMKSKGKGYRAGQPDLLVLNKHRKYNGLAIEFKTPSGRGRVSEDQEAFLNDLERNNYLVLVCDKFEQAMMTIVNYNKDLMFKCERTGRYFNSLESLERHQRLMITGEASDETTN
jgi:prophage antirepressor-like protein